MDARNRRRKPVEALNRPGGGWVRREAQIAPVDSLGVLEVPRCPKGLPAPRYVARGRLAVAEVTARDERGSPADGADLGQSPTRRKPGIHRGQARPTRRVHSFGVYWSGGKVRMADDVLFKRLKIAGWRQFASIDVEFHDRLTVLTGANGAGKSTLLNILARHVGAERPYLGVPKRDPTSGNIFHISGRLISTGREWWSRLFGAWEWGSQPDQVGELHYTSGIISPLAVPERVGTTYQLSVAQQQDVKGVVIGSHRLMPNYRAVPYISFAGIKPQDAYGMFQSEANQRYLGQSSNDSSLMFQIKTALAAWAAIGEGNSVLQPNKSQKDAYDGFIEMLRQVLPESLGFETVAIRAPDIVLVTKTGEFLIDAASGGITNLIEIGALIYGLSIRPDVKDKRFVVVYDEPENHLHPQLQRTLFERLTKAFPKAQFIAATHSPFIVSSLKDSNVYVLRYEKTGDSESTQQSRVVSERLDYVNRAGNASEILREVLGLPTTLPKWVEDDLQSIVQRYQQRELTRPALNDLKLELHNAGLGELFPDALSKLAQQHQ